MFIVRPANAGDFKAIFTLYKKVAAAPVGIARPVEEITETYIKHFMEHPDNTDERFYKNLGFISEGRFEKRIFLGNELFEADVPMACFNPTYGRM